MTPLASTGRGVQRLMDGDPVAWTILIVTVVVGWVLIPLACWRWGRKRSNRKDGPAEPPAGPGPTGDTPGTS